ncbi:unnamed protein product [Arctia plantaginis]|uniref:Uncharacterized protein n=1 Tax=Arctia plantaginis TaxID=874455 RepID=A0A8S0ZNN8_ARCPL|nr:unnamed protein product [Arctia plantaginis]
MQFYRRKDGQSYLVLHSNEWNRLKRQPGPEKTLNEQQEYVKSLNEKSRAWTQTWPDHKHGVIANYEKKQQKLRETQLAIVNSEKQKQKFKKQSNIEAIKQARQRIFDESCYGRKLLSAFRESKTLEERDAQVQFLKKLKEEKVIETKKIKIPAFCSFDLDKYIEDEKKCRRATAIQMAQQNKEMQVKIIFN